jgi:hypothetical protein
MRATAQTWFSDLRAAADTSSIYGRTLPMRIMGKLILSAGSVSDDDDEEFGLDRLELLLKNNGGRPLPQLWELIMDEVACWVSTSTSV